MTDAGFEPKFDAKRHLRVAAFAGALLVFVIGGWSVFTEIAGAVVGQGTLVVDGSVKKIQHPTGGVVGDLRVRDGDRVRAGDLLVRLDETQVKANLGVILKSLDELAAREARAEAELNGAGEVRFPEELLSRVADPRVAEVVAGERKLFESRREARNGQQKQLRAEISGLEVQREARVGQIGWIGKELEGVKELWQKNLIPYARLTSLEREAARLEGERGQLMASIAQAEAKIIQIDQDLRAEVGKDRAEIRAKVAELTEKRAAAEDQMKRIDIRSPQNGVVLQSAVHTVGGVIGAGEQIMLIVPNEDALVVETHVQPQDIDQIRIGQEAGLKFTSFSQRLTPELSGEVMVVSADVAQDQKTGANFYTVRLSVKETEVAKLGGARLVPGMPVETFIKTADRTPIAYLMKPLRDQMARAFREK